MFIKPSSGRFVQNTAMLKEVQDGEEIIVADVTDRMRLQTFFFLNDTFTGMFWVGQTWKDTRVYDI